MISSTNLRNISLYVFNFMLIFSVIFLNSCGSQKTAQNTPGSAINKIYYTDANSVTPEKIFNFKQNDDIELKPSYTRNKPSGYSITQDDLNKLEALGLHFDRTSGQISDATSKTTYFGTSGEITVSDMDDSTITTTILITIIPQPETIDYTVATSYSTATTANGNLVPYQMHLFPDGKKLLNGYDISNEDLTILNKFNLTLDQATGEIHNAENGFLLPGNLTIRVCSHDDKSVCTTVTLTMDDGYSTSVSSNIENGGLVQGSIDLIAIIKYKSPSSTQIIHLIFSLYTSPDIPAKEIGEGIINAKTATFTSFDTTQISDGTYQIQYNLIDANGQSIQIVDANKFIISNHVRDSNPTVSNTLVEDTPAIKKDSSIVYNPRLIPNPNFYAYTNANAVLVGFKGTSFDSTGPSQSLQAIWAVSYAPSKSITDPTIINGAFHTNPTTLQCNAGDAVIGIYGAADNEIDKLQIICDKLNSTDGSQRYTLQNAPFIGFNKMENPFGTPTNLTTGPSGLQCKKGTFITNFTVNYGSRPWWHTNDESVITGFIGNCN